MQLINSIKNFIFSQKLYSYSHFSMNLQTLFEQNMTV